MLRLAFATPTHEDLFLERYDRLVIAAATLTAGDRDAARELVHEAYVQFVLTRPPLESVGQLDSYLFVTLRNLHVSRVRRSLRMPHQSLALLDFDSAALGLRTLSVARSLQAADDLRWICEYALKRRIEVRAASAFLLRYFLGYRPSEIALLLRSSVAIVHKLLHVARADVRAALERADASAHSPRARGSHVPDLLELRRTIFESPIGACVSRARLIFLYNSPEAIDVTTLAHIVGCVPCLDRAHALVDVPRPVDHDRHGGTGQSTGRSAAAPHVSRGRLADEADAVESTREHRPKELHIVVNGLAMGMQHVAGPYNDQLVRLNTHDPIAFIEIFSDQDVRLLLLNAEPLATAGVAVQTASAALSEQRELEVSLDLADVAPTLRVTYRDPLFSTDELLEDVEREVGRADLAREAPVAARTWSVWPSALRFVIAGIILGVLLANPQRTLAAVAQVHRAVVDSVTLLIERVRPRAVVPSRPVTRPGHLAPLVAPAASDGPEVSRSTPRSSASEAATDVELSQLAVEALQLLDGVGALTTEQIGVTRGWDRRVHVDGIVDTEVRRRELAALLGVLPARHLRVDLTSVDTATRQPRMGQARTSSPLRSAEVTQDRVPAAFEDVRRYVVARAPRDHTPMVAADVANAVREISGTILSQSLQARVRGGTVRDLVVSVSPADASRLTATTLARWRELVRRHADLFQQETSLLRRQLEPLFWPDKAGERAVAPAVPVGDAWQLAARLFELASAHDIAVRRAFAVAANGHESLDASTHAFRQSLLEAEQLADAVLAAMPSASNR